jgi:hypothetical protein
MVSAMLHFRASGFIKCQKAVRLHSGLQLCDFLLSTRSHTLNKAGPFRNNLAIAVYLCASKSLRRRFPWYGDADNASDDGLGGRCRVS